MKQKDVDAIAYEVNDYFTEDAVRRLIEAIEEAPNALVQALEEYWEKK